MKLRKNKPIEIETGRQVIKPKFRIGQSVWVLDEDRAYFFAGSVRGSVITDMEITIAGGGKDIAIKYGIQGCVGWFNEDRLFTSLSEIENICKDRGLK